MEPLLRGIHPNVHLKGRYHWKGAPFSKGEGKKFCCYHLRKSVPREAPPLGDAGQGARHPHCESPSSGDHPAWCHNVGVNVEEGGRASPPTTKGLRGKLLSGKLLSGKLLSEKLLCKKLLHKTWLEDKRICGYSSKGERNAWHSILPRCCFSPDSRCFPPCSRRFTSLPNGPQPKHKLNHIVLTDQFVNREKLKKEILDTHKKLTADSFIDKRKEEIYFLLKSAIMPNLKGKIYFVGSCENHIWIKNSDIDCCIVVENCEDKNSYLYILKVIKSAINLIYPSLTVNIIKASVPIAKIYREQNNICDISINNTVAIVNTKLVSSLCNTDERVTIINRVIKYWAKQKNINNRSQGTFSSYALFLLTYYFLQNLETPLLPPYKSIERENASSFEINSEYFFLQDDVEMPFYTDAGDIKSKLDTPRKNEDDVSKLLYGFFEFYSRSSCRNGITLDVYNNQIIENKDMTANIFCPITKRIVNTYSINTWKKMFQKILAAHERLKGGKSLDVICEETKNTTPNRKIDLKDHLLRRKIFQGLHEP
ncbi:nucleotidyltransferase, putative [Plasmodium vivax]|uniref:Nucleotidyltransferase, putative n=1 Tax=Plasmodium vivax TaxID=5855 RepID=A0A565A2T4_PLAVI|nr:nucleotidyltransferase, putative [Plasmodium vivax]